jgi:hypothetical protein
MSLCGLDGAVQERAESGRVCCDVIGVIGATAY